MATSDKMVFLQSWFEELQGGDDFVETSPQEMAYILYAAANYAFYGNKTNLGEVFGKEYAGLNRTMSGYYPQIERILARGVEQATKNSKYDDDAIRDLAAKGYTQRKICEELGYDVSKSRSLSSNPGYKKGREEWVVSSQGKTDESVSSTFTF